MSLELRSYEKSIILIGDVKHQLTVSKLPSNGQVLKVLFYNIREVNLTLLLMKVQISLFQNV